MPEPLVTREQAAEALAWAETSDGYDGHHAPVWVDELAETVLALYDERAAWADHVCPPLSLDQYAMRECIDRLRDGRVGCDYYGTGVWQWVGPTTEDDDGPVEPMTPEQQAVMARA